VSIVIDTEIMSSEFFLSYTGVKLPWIISSDNRQNTKVMHKYGVYSNERASSNRPEQGHTSTFLSCHVLVGKSVTGHLPCFST